MSLIALPRRMSAAAALSAPVAIVLLVGFSLSRHPWLLIAATLCGGLAVRSTVAALTTEGRVRILAAAVALVSIIAPIVLLLRYGNLIVIAMVILLVLVTGVCARHALGRDTQTLKCSPTPGVPVGPARHGVLLMNPRSGGGKVAQLELVDEARKRSIEAVVLQPGDDIVVLAQRAVENGADVIGMAGGDGSQALVASVATQHDVAFVCVPAGTRNHLAMDLGLDRSDVLGALDAFGDAVERRIDLGMVNNRVFVNNATVGLYAKIVQSPEYRNNKMGTVLELLPQMLKPDTDPFDLRYTGPDGEKHVAAHLILVSNGPYQLDVGEGFGSRERIDLGVLGIVAARFEAATNIAQIARMPAARPVRRSPGWNEWTATTFEIRSGAPVEIGIDGEATMISPPLQFRIMPGALRVRIPRSAPGYSPAASRLQANRWTIRSLMHVLAGHPVSITP